MDGVGECGKEKERAAGVIILSLRPTTRSATTRELELAVLSAEDEHAEILRGEHHTTVSK